MDLVPAARLGSLPLAELAEAMRPLWEDAEPLAAALTGVEVTSWSAHIDRAADAIAAMSDAAKAALLEAHPRIGAPPAQLAARSTVSLAEQGGAVEDAAVLARLEAGNEAYERRFGFAFVEWVAGRTRTEMAEVLEARTARDRATELRAGCDALVAIARDRLAKLGVD